MNILQICANYPPVTSGFGVYAQNLSLELLKYGVDTTILTFKPKGLEISEKEDLLKVKRIPALNIESIEFPIFYPTIILDIHKIVNKNDIDVINSHTRFFTSSYFASLYKKLNKKVTFVHTEHGAGPLIHKNNTISSVCNIYDNTFGKWTINSADIPLAIGPKSRDFLTKLGCKKEVKIIPNSINCSKFDIESKKHDNIIITYIGRLVKSKGVSDLIKVFSEIEKKFDAILYIVGTGPDEGELKILTNILNINNIHFLGFIKDISSILSVTDILVNPSNYDSMPTTVIEAGCSGIRIISTNVGDVPYIVGNNYPYLYDSGSLDKLREFIVQAILKSDFRDYKLKERIHKLFDWKMNAKKYLKIINGK